MKTKIKLRFFIILALPLIGIVFLFIQRIPSKVKNQRVLAANTYTLQEHTKADSNPSGGGEIYDSVTISYTVKDGDTLASVAEKYHADAQTILDYPYNNIPDDLALKVGQNLIIPNGYIDGQPTPILPPIVSGTGQFLWPIRQAQGEPAHGIVTQYSSWFHPGAIDIGIALGTPVVAADDGTVIAVEHLAGGYGSHIIISHGDGLTSLYAHLSDVRVGKGDRVSKGDVIGLSGSSGRSTGPHLHFEVRRNGQPIDPMTML